MDVKKLTREERSAITALVHSPGWAVLMEKLLIPQIREATRYLDRPDADGSQANFMRGVKRGYMRAVELVYHIAQLPHPFERHALALVADVRYDAGVSAVSDVGPGGQSLEDDQRLSASAFGGVGEEWAHIRGRSRGGFPI